MKHLTKTMTLILHSVILTTAMLFSFNSFSKGSLELYGEYKFKQAFEAVDSELTKDSSPFKIKQKIELALKIYGTSPKVTEARLLKLLEKASSLKSSSQVNYPIKETIEAFRDLKLNYSQEHLANKLAGNVITGTDTSIISNNPRRLSVFRAIYLYSTRKWKNSKKESEQDYFWKFLAGKAGSYYFNSGLESLKDFLDYCGRQTTKKNSCTKYLKEAEDLYETDTGVELSPGQKEDQR